MKLKKLLICIAIPLIIGGIAALITSNSMNLYGELIKPSINPPGYIFPIVWTILYVLMGIASYLVLTSNNSQNDIHQAITIYALQLFLNFLWPIFFFSFGWYLFSFIWLLILWVFVFITILLFYQLSKPAAYLMIPYLLWITFAGYLNLSIYLLN